MFFTKIHMIQSFNINVISAITTNSTHVDVANYKISYPISYPNTIIFYIKRVKGSD